MRRIFYLMSFLFMALVFTACPDDEVTFLTVKENMTTLEFSKDGGSLVLSVQSNTDWSISGISDWISLSAVSGINDKDLTVVALSNDTGVERQTDFTIRSNNGKHTIVVTIKQAGSGSGNYFEVNSMEKKIFSGNLSAAEDSIVVNSSVRWTIEGPSWLSASFNNVRLSLNADVIREGSGTIVLSVTSQNGEEESREGVIRIQSLSDNSTLEIPVEQVGKDMIIATNIVKLTDGFACDFKYGVSVAYFSYKTFEGTASYDELAISEVQNWNYGEAKNNIVYSVGGKSPNTVYTLYTIGINSERYFTSHMNITTVRTPEDFHQPIASIENPTLMDDGWHYTVRPNEYTTSYYLFSNSGTTYFNRNNAYIAYHIYRSIKRGLSPKSTNSVSWVYRSLNDCVISTWAVGAGNTLSGRISVRGCLSSTSEVKDQKFFGDEMESAEERIPDKQLSKMFIQY